MHGFPRNFILKTFMKICREIPVLVKTGQKYRTRYMNTKVCFFVAGVLSSKKSLLCNTQYFMLLSVACSPTTHREGIVALALQQWLLERISISCYTYIAYIVRNYTSTETLLVNFRMVAKTLRRPFLSASFPIRPTIDHTKS